jgi:hypothetical protein
MEDKTIRGVRIVHESYQPAQPDGRARVTAAATGRGGGSNGKGETRRQMAERRVREGLKNMEWQERLIAKMKAYGHDTDREELLLANFRSRFSRPSLARLTPSPRPVRNRGPVRKTGAGHLLDPFGHTPRGGALINIIAQHAATVLAQDQPHRFYPADADEISGWRVAALALQSMAPPASCVRIKSSRKLSIKVSLEWCRAPCNDP